MNEQLQSLARAKIKSGLIQCNKGQRLLFLRMYAHGNMDASIDSVVDGLSEDKLDWAMLQVQATLDKAKAKEETTQ